MFPCTKSEFKPIRRLIINLSLILVTNTIFAQNLSPKPFPAESNLSESAKKFLSKNAKSDLEVVWFEPNKKSGVASKWMKMELGLKLPFEFQNQIDNYLHNQSRGLNPYDPEQINCLAYFISPNGTVKKTNGFYYLPQIRKTEKSLWIEDTTSYPWRIRFALDEVGDWELVVSFQINKEESATQNLTSYHRFNCENSSHKGKLISGADIGKNPRYFYHSDTEEPYFSIGGTVAHSSYYNLTPESSLLHLHWLDELGQNSANYFRLELSGRNGLPDWEDAENYDAMQNEMWEFDKYVAKAEEYQMYFTIYRHHIEVLDENEWDLVRWGNNPYRELYNLTSRLPYFTDEDLIKQQQKCLQYIFARWGYTPYFAFYGYTEVDYWYKPLIENENFDLSSAEETFANWLKTNHQYIRENTNYCSGLFASGYTSNRSVSKLEKSQVIPIEDMIPLHAYQKIKWGNYEEIYTFVEEMRDLFPDKPIQLEEVGQLADTYCCTDAEFHNCLWSNSMMAITGTPNHWWWDRGIHYAQYYETYNNVAAFFNNEPVANAYYSQQRWADKSGARNKLHKAKLENYAMVSEDKNKALGWIHNATYYWRNQVENPCIQDLLIDNKLEVGACVVEDGTVMGQGDMFYQNEVYKDHYSDKGGVVELESGKETKFRVKNLHTNWIKLLNPFAKKHWYKISYFTTRGEASDKAIKTEYISANLCGKIKPKAPDLNMSNPDYAYKISYVGKFKSVDEIKL